MKDYIVERLITQGHITIEMADILLNDRLEKSSLIADLKRDGQISVVEAITLLKDGNAPIQAQPFQTFPSMPYMPQHPINPGTGSPFWYTTTTSGTKPPFEYPDTKWPGEKTDK